MSTQDADLGLQVLRIVSMRARTGRADPEYFAPGLNVISGATSADVAMLRTVFESLTRLRPPGVDVVLDLGGTVLELDETFAHRIGTTGAEVPVLDWPGVSQGRFSPPPVSQNALRMEQLTRAAGKLRSELELVRREIGRETERAGETGHDAEFGIRGRSGLHPADVAVMCDRLRDLQSFPPDVEMLQLASILEEVSARRVYGIYRQEALDQLVAECADAIDSAEQFLDAEMVSGSGGPGREDHDEILRAGARNARTIARLDLLVEVAEFWRARSGELDEQDEHFSQTLARANELLHGEGRPEVQSPTLAAVRLRELASAGINPAESEAVRELTEALRGFLGADIGGEAGSGVGELAGLELVERVEALLAAGAAPARGVPDADPPLSESPRMEQLRSTERRLGEELQVIGDALAALERGQDAIETTRALPNPFTAAAPDSPDGPTPGADPKGGTDPTDLLRSVGSVPDGPRLPVLLVESSGGWETQGGPDARSVLLAAGPGQVIWVTDRAEVLRDVRSMGEDVNLIEL